LDQVTFAKSNSNYNCVDDFSYDELEFENIDEFTIEYESFINDKPRHDMFNFNDECSMDIVIDVVYAVMLLLCRLTKPLTDSLKYGFLGFNESLPIIIASYLAQDK